MSTLEFVKGGERRITSDALAQVSDKPRIAGMPELDGDLSAFLEAQMAGIGGRVCNIISTRLSFLSMQRWADTHRDTWPERDTGRSLRRPGSIHASNLDPCTIWLDSNEYWH
jgi:hypothetical protein